MQGNTYSQEIELEEVRVIIRDSHSTEACTSEVTLASAHMCYMPRIHPMAIYILIMMTGMYTV